MSTESNLTSINSHPEIKKVKQKSKTNELCTLVMKYHKLDTTCNENYCMLYKTQTNTYSVIQIIQAPIQKHTTNHALVIITYPWLMVHSEHSPPYPFHNLWDFVLRGGECNISAWFNQDGFLHPYFPQIDCSSCHLAMSLTLKMSRWHKVV